MILFRVLEEEEQYLHLTSPNTFLTLCGWCDVLHEPVEGDLKEVNCPTCLEIVKWCKSLNLK